MNGEFIINGKTYIARNDCPRLIIIELIDYISMLNNGQRAVVAWDLLKHSWVTVDMFTIWQLSELHMQTLSGYDAIGRPEQMRLSLAETIYKALKEVNR